MAVMGTKAVETHSGAPHVEAGERFLVGPGNPHRADAPEDGDGPVVVLAIGAPSVDDVAVSEP